jgi:uncharacterized protein (UPF0332 family)
VTEGSIAKHVGVEMARARALRAEADVAAGAGLHGRAAGALYYAALHASRALLAIRDLDPKSHAGIRTLISLHFVKTGLLDAEFVRCLSDLQEAREGSDYLATYSVSLDEYRTLAAAADRVLADVSHAIGEAPS